MAWLPTELRTILTQVVARLISSGTYTAENCFLSLSPPTETPFTAGDVAGNWCIVYPGNGDFDQALLAGGGEDTCLETAQIVVEIFSPVAEDEAGRDLYFLTGADGIGPLVKGTLKALTNFPLVDGSSNEILAEPMRPLARTIPQRENSELPTGSIALVFETRYYWNLT